MPAQAAIAVCAPIRTLWRDLDQVVELAAVLDDGVVQSAAVDAAVGADLDVVADHDSTELGYLAASRRALRGAMPKPSAPMTVPEWMITRCADLAVRQHGDSRMQAAFGADAAVVADHGAGADPGVVTDGAAGADDHALLDCRASPMTALGWTQALGATAAGGFGLTRRVEPSRPTARSRGKARRSMQQVRLGCERPAQASATRCRRSPHSRARPRAAAASPGS